MTVFHTNEHQPSSNRPRLHRGTVILALSVAATVIAVCTAAVVSQSAWTATRPDSKATAASATSASAPASDSPADNGELPEGASVLDTSLPGIARLDPALLSALQSAAIDAEADGVTFVVNSGWRSGEYQTALLDEAVSTYGSAAEASRWVASAATSEHVAGRAVDVGGLDAVDWLTQRGAAYGLCQTYANESWHFELQPDAPAIGCAAQYPDPTYDPRMAG